MATISDELSTLNDNLLIAYSAIDNMGGTIPADKNTDNLATAISSIPSGGGGTTTVYVIGPYSPFTLSANSWDRGTYTLTINKSLYNVGEAVQIGIPTDSTATNTNNIIKAGLSTSLSSGTTSATVTIQALSTPTVDLNIILFGIETIPTSS